MRRTELLRYCRDLGWSDPPDLPDLGDVGTTTPPATLEELSRLVAGCSLCDLAAKRRKIVFGEGGAQARLMFIGEGPGAEEDKTGRPFVGQGGRILDGMIFALGLDRSQVYIANVVKCRPPRNRDPEVEEMAACAPFLERQIELIKPEVIVALGRVAARRLTGTEKPMGALRGRWTTYRGLPLMPTYHPAYLLRNQDGKKLVWQDLKKVVEKLS
ncbi:MAG: uracil-DNA glycosylase [Thermoanaerobaculales bacterium]|nr:uracil-DNA glycosylase [Thermoanaerobaculales bacterium]